jgi:hypothetical protein
MHLTQTSENSSQATILRRVFRLAPFTQQPETEPAEKSAIYLDDGNSLQRFEFGSNCKSLPEVNHLLRVSYFAESGTKVIYSYDMPKLSEIADFYGFEITNTEREEHSEWNLPLQEISSNELHDLMTFFRKAWAEKMIIDSLEDDFCILEPSCIVDYKNITNVLNELSYVDPICKQQALMGGYLFCIYKSYYKILGDRKASIIEHRFMIGEIEKLLIKLEYRNNYLASLLRKYCHVASLNTSHDITEFPTSTQLVWDLYQHFQPAIDRSELPRFC